MTTRTTLTPTSSLVAAALVVAALTSCTCGAPPAPPGEGEGEGEGGGEGEGDPDFNACVAVADGPGFAISAKADLRWKRGPQLQNDLKQALTLDDNTVCGELGLGGTCFNLIHQVPLGGNEPVKSGLYRPIAAPGVTTSLSIDRVVLSACGIRADAEFLDAVPHTVFANIDFSAPSLSADDPAVAADITELYHLLLARDPTPEEVAILASLAEDVSGEPVPPRDFAKMACYAIATTSEALFQ